MRTVFEQYQLQERRKLLTDMLPKVLSDMFRYHDQFRALTRLKSMALFLEKDKQTCYPWFWGIEAVWKYPQKTLVYRFDYLLGYKNILHKLLSGTYHPNLLIIYDVSKLWELSRRELLSQIINYAYHHNVVLWVYFISSTVNTTYSFAQRKKHRINHDQQKILEEIQGLKVKRPLDWLDQSVRLKFKCLMNC